MINISTLSIQLLIIAIIVGLILIYIFATGKHEKIESEKRPRAFLGFEGGNMLNLMIKDFKYIIDIFGSFYKQYLFLYFLYP